MIVSTAQLYKVAYGRFAVGAYNINNAEQTMGLFRGCIESQAPFIIQISEGARINAGGGKFEPSACGVNESEHLPAAKLGVTKVNIDTDGSLVWTRVHREYFRDKARRLRLPPAGEDLPGRIREIHRRPEPAPRQRRNHPGNTKISRTMKTTSPLLRLTLCAALVLGFLTFHPAANAQGAPGIDALRVAKIATDYLATHGKGAPHIVSIALESDALMGGKVSWIVRFSRPVLTDGNKETGMRVKTDGNVSFLIEDKSGPKKNRVPVKF